MTQYRIKKGIINMKCTSLILTGLKLACWFLLNLATIIFSTVTFAASVCCQYFSVSASLELLFVSLKMTRKKKEENIFAKIQVLSLAFMKGQLNKCLLKKTCYWNSLLTSTAFLVNSSDLLQMLCGP